MKHLLATIGTVALFVHLGAERPVAARSSSDGAIAMFEGNQINLRDGWGEATACASDDTGTRCYRSETEMDDAEGVELDASPSVMVACSTALRLYSGTGYGGSVLSLSTRYTNINLSGYGFNNVTSSYRVGACSSYFYDGANGGAPQYPGNTSAGSSSSSMLAGWDNRVSSVYIL